MTVKFIDKMGSDLSVVNAARTSFAKESEFEWVEREDSPTMYKQTLSDKDKKLIYDAFLGSGSTLIAAEKLKRKCYGMELDEKYCDVIINRWEQFTGLKATIINGTK